MDEKRSDVEAARPAAGRRSALAAAVDRAVYHLAGHWIAFIHLLILLFLAPSVAAPALMATGHAGAARILYAIYQPTCHQLPERSFFLFGRQAAYTQEELVAAGMDPTLSALRRRYVFGTPELGYKMVICERDTAIYAGIVAFGILYALTRPRWPRSLRSLPWWGFVLFLVPAAADGISQAIGWRESTPWLRTVSGLLVAAGSVWFAYPTIDAAMTDLRRDLARKLDRPAQ